jgi:hypothetical protein
VMQVVSYEVTTFEAMSPAVTRSRCLLTGCAQPKRCVPRTDPRSRRRTATGQHARVLAFPGSFAGAAAQILAVLVDGPGFVTPHASRRASGVLGLSVSGCPGTRPVGGVNGPVSGRLDRHTGTLLNYRQLSPFMHGPQLTP